MWSLSLFRVFWKLYIRATDEAYIYLVETTVLSTLHGATFLLGNLFLNRPSSINDVAINRLTQVECNLLLDEFPTVAETVKAINFCHLARLQDQMQYLLRSTKQEELQIQRRWQSYFTLCGEKKPSLKNSRMRQLSTYSNVKGFLSCVIIIVHLLIVICWEGPCNVPT